MRTPATAGSDVPSTLRTIRPDGSPGRTLARPLLGLPDAEWSPDGTHVAMVVGKEPNRIVILDVHTDERSVVIRSEDVPDSRFIDSLGISPDGQTLVFCSVRRDGTSLYTIGVDGSALTKISGARQECQPDWGVTDRIAAEAFGSGSKIVTMEPDGSDRAILIAGRDADRAAIFSSPSWSPDGERARRGFDERPGGDPGPLDRRCRRVGPHRTHRHPASDRVRARSSRPTAEGSPISMSSRSSRERTG